MKTSIKGFTMIELLISITLGLILVTVATQLLISSQRNYRIQQAASTVQDNGVFSLNAVTKNIRLANHGNIGLINDETLYGGVVLSAQSAGTHNGLTLSGNLTGLKWGGTLITGNKYVSLAAAHEGGLGAGLKSDQLVIMYQAPIDMVTCTGKALKGPRKTFSDTTYEFTQAKGWYAIERYYIKKENGTSNLYCSDARFVADTKDAPSAYAEATTDTIDTAQSIDADYGTNGGQMIARNVDYMKVKLIVRKELSRNKVGSEEREIFVDNTDSIDISEFATYKTAMLTQLGAIATTRQPKGKLGIVGIQLGWLVKSDEKIENNKKLVHKVLDQDVIVNDDKFMRHVYSTTIAIRNGGVGELME